MATGKIHHRTLRRWPDLLIAAFLVGLWGFGLASWSRFGRRHWPLILLGATAAGTVALVYRRAHREELRWTGLTLREQKRSREGRCTACGYDLKGNETGRCPECGHLWL
ncbi:MAG: hypothetical protein FLDDKLPJ_02444 [Phycisphaerae bacterium]|nr:hypothetical protein [Phycisphaerae bacterium]